MTALVPSFMITIGFAFVGFGVWQLSKVIVSLIGAYIVKSNYEVTGEYVWSSLLVFGAGVNLAFYGMMMVIKS